MPGQSCGGSGVTGRTRSLPHRARKHPHEVGCGHDAEDASVVGDEHRVGSVERHLSGLYSTIGYLDARVLNRGTIVDVVREKLGQSRVAKVSRFDGKVPRTPQGIAGLLEERPPAWEYLLYAAIIHRESLNDKYRDHVIQYARSIGITLSDDAAMQMINDQAI
jgi:hypothetical protein